MASTQSNQMFSNAHNLQISGGQFHVGNVNTEIVIGAHNGFDLLRRHSALGALLDSNERFDAPRCHPDTRIVILRRIMDWIISDQKSTTIKWLHGSAGAGKSALAQSIAELCSTQGRLAGTFFFSRSALNASRSDGNALVATLAYQVMLAIPKTRRHLKKTILKDPSIFDRTIETQMEHLLVTPITHFRRSLGYYFQRLVGTVLHLNHPRLIVIDGLDECQDPKIQAEILKAVGAAAKKLTNFPFRILIASRPEAHINRIFEHYPPLRNLSIVSRINLDDDIDSDEDIRRFIVAEFAKIVGMHPLRTHIPIPWPAEDDLATLVRRSSQHFIYASTIIKYIESPRHRPTERLQIILGLSPIPENDTPYATLDALYTHIFASMDPEHDAELVMQILSLLLIPRSEDDGLGEFDTAVKIETLLALESGDVEIILGDLLSIVRFIDRDSPIKLHHASLGDFLLNPVRSASLVHGVDLGRAHEQIARGYMRLLRDSLGQMSSFKFAQLSSYLSIFINHCEKATLSENLEADLESFEFSTFYRRLSVSQDILDLDNIPEPFRSKELSGLGAIWYNRQVWNFGLIPQLFYLTLRNGLRNGEHIFFSFLQSLDNHYCLDNSIKHSLTLLLANAQFGNLKPVSININHVIYSTRSQNHHHLATMLHKALHMSILYHVSQDDTTSAYDCQAYFLLTFVYSIVTEAIGASNQDEFIEPGMSLSQKLNPHPLAGNRQSVSGLRRRNAIRNSNLVLEKRRERRRHMRSDAVAPYVDNYLGACINCGVILLSHSTYSHKLATLLRRFNLQEWRSHSLISPVFNFQIDALELEINHYLLQTSNQEENQI